MDKLKNVNGVVIKPAKWLFVMNVLVFALLLIVLPGMRISSQGLEIYLHSNFFLIHITLVVLVAVYFIYLISQRTVLVSDGIYRQSFSIRGIVIMYISLVDIKYWNDADLCVELAQHNGEIIKVPLLSFSNEDKEKFKIWLKKSGLPNK